MPLVIERLEGGKRGMKAEEPVEVENRILRNGDAGTHFVVVLLAVRHDNVESVGCSSLEDDHEPLAWCETGCCLGQNRADQKTWDGRCTGNGVRAIAQEKSTVGLHCAPSFFFFLLLSRQAL